MMKLGMSHDEIVRLLNTTMTSESYKQELTKRFNDSIAVGMSETEAALTAQLAMTAKVFTDILAKNNELISSQIEELLKTHRQECLGNQAR